MNISIKAYFHPDSKKWHGTMIVPHDDGTISTYIDQVGWDDKETAIENYQHYIKSFQKPLEPHRKDESHEQLISRLTEKNKT